MKADKKPLPTWLLVLSGMLVGLATDFVAILAIGEIGGLGFFMSNWYLVVLVGLVVVPYALGIALPCVYFHRRNKRRGA